MNKSIIKQTKIRHLLAGAAILTGFATAPASYAGNSGGNCVPYQLSSYGGEAGVRTMENTGNFRRTGGGNISGQFCGNGSVTVELSKRHPGTTVKLYVNGYEYVFGRGDRGNRVANDWYRRYYTINLPYYEQQYSKKHQKKHKNKHRPKGHSDNHSGYERYDDDSHYGYNDSGYGNQHYSQKNHYGHKPKAHSHGHGIGPKPRLRIGSKLHRDAHKLRLPHQHKKEHVVYH